jgi:hypothetical protein
MDSSDSDALLACDVEYGQSLVALGSARDVVTVIPASVKRLSIIFNRSTCPAKQRAFKNLQIAARKKWVSTTVFSGDGTFEVLSSWGLDSVREHFLEAGAEPGCTYYYSTTDTGRTSKKALALHDERTLADHSFENVLDRLHHNDREELDGITGNILEKFSALKEERKNDQIEKKAFIMQKRVLSKEIVFRLTSVLEKCEFKEEVPCCRHNCLCKVHPASDPRYRDAHWVEAGGNICTPWSLIGANTGWLDWATLSCLVWSFSTRFYEPRALVQECAPAFDQLPFKQALCAEHTDDMPKSLYSDPKLGPCVYEHDSNVFSAAVLGVQASRKRLYATFTRKMSRRRWPTPSFEDNFVQAPFVDGSVYMGAPEKVIADELEVRLETVKDVNASALLDDSQVASLSTADAVRLESWECYLEERGYFSRDPTKPRAHAASKIWPATTTMCVANISQTPHFYKQAGTAAFPAILPRGLYFDVYRSRLVTTCEEWVINGWPHPAIPSIADVAAERCPFPHALMDPLVERVQKLSLREQRALLGNGMHMQQAGVWFLQFLLSNDFGD